MSADSFNRKLFYTLLIEFSFTLHFFSFLSILFSCIRYANNNNKNWKTFSLQESIARKMWMSACPIRVKMVDIVVIGTMAIPAPVSRATWASIVKLMWPFVRRVSVRRVVCEWSQSRPQCECQKI